MNKKYEIVKFKDEEFELDVTVSPREDTVWLNQEEMALLFKVDRTRITRHIKNIYIEGELRDISTCAEIAQVQIEGGREIQRVIKYYNLDMILSVGYRVRSNRGIIFRKWCNSILKEYMLRGYVINEDRTLVTNENYINLINKVENMDNRIINIENKINSQELPLEKI